MPNLIKFGGIDRHNQQHKRFKCFSSAANPIKTSVCTLETPSATNDLKNLMVITHAQWNSWPCKSVLIYCHLFHQRDRWSTQICLFWKRSSMSIPESIAPVHANTHLKEIYKIHLICCCITGFCVVNMVKLSQQDTMELCELKTVKLISICFQLHLAASSDAF